MYQSDHTYAILTGRDTLLLIQALAGEHPEGHEARRYELAQRLAAELRATNLHAPALSAAARVPRPEWLAKSD